jgi:hypothetical protein
MSRAIYLHATTVVPWLLKDLEAALVLSTDGDVVNPEFVRQHCTSRTPSREETALALKGLNGIGILRKTGSNFAVDRTAFEASRGYRSGVWDVLALPKRAAGDSPSLCVGLPPLIPQIARRSISARTPDLRAAILSVISASSRRLVLASPFWDVTTATEIGELAKRRSDAGVRVDILGRSASDRVTTTIVKLFAGARGFRLFKWYQARPQTAATTFHFKAVVADDGQRAYVGTANLTQASLRSTMELGFVIGPEPGCQVAEILDVVIGMSELVYSC